MIKKAAAVLFMTTALSGAAMAQMNSAPATTTSGSAATSAPMTSASGGFVTEQTTGEFRASKFVGLNVYGSENQKIGDIKEVLVDANGQAKAVVIGVGGFLGIGEKNVAVPWNSVQWKMDKAQTTASTTTTTTGTAATAPATTGSTAPAGSTTASTSSNRTPAEQAAYNGYPDHAMIAMSKADLQNAPDFKYYADTRSSK